MKNETPVFQDVMRREDAAKYLNICLRTFDRIRTKGLPEIRLGKSVRFLKSDIDHFLETNRVFDYERRKPKKSD